MSDLDSRQRETKVKNKKNMLEWACEQYNEYSRGDRDNESDSMANLMKSIKDTPRIYSTVNRAVLEYQAEKSRKKESPKTPVVDAKDIIDEMYR